ncbi:MAG: MASE2 domain-containing protein [Halopseudomonas sp.]|uniref:MASE2 domain-containing protein n=1 Tax=Halopseudomonas sp. TaxID=2901191 RepID=UPI003000FB9E
MATASPSGSHWIVQLNHRNRSASFFALFAALGIHLHALGHGWSMVFLLALQFLLYPQLLYWRAIRSPQPLATELNHLLLDALLFGAWASWMGFPLWLSFTMFIGVCINLMVFRGPRGLAQALVALSLGAAPIWLFGDGRL